MNEMSSNRDYDNRDYRDYRDYRDNYRDYRDGGNYRDDYREDYRDNYRRDYDRRGGKINNRNYRNYRGGDFYGELEDVCYDMKEMHRKIEDVAEMADNPQEKNALTRIAQKEKENYMMLKQIMDK